MAFKKRHPFFREKEGGGFEEKGGERTIRPLNLLAAAPAFSFGHNRNTRSRLSVFARGGGLRQGILTFLRSDAEGDLRRGGGKTISHTAFNELEAP